MQRFIHLHANLRLHVTYKPIFNTPVIHIVEIDTTNPNNQPLKDMLTYNICEDIVAFLKVNPKDDPYNIHNKDFYLYCRDKVVRKFHPGARLAGVTAYTHLFTDLNQNKTCYHFDKNMLELMYNN